MATDTDANGAAEPQALEPTVAVDAGAGPTGARPLAAEPERRSGPGFATKFFFAATAIVAVSLGTALAVASWRANQIAEESIREELNRVPLLFDAYRASLEAGYVAQTRSLASLSGTKAVYGEVNAATRHEFALDFRDELGAHTVFLFDYAGEVLGRTDRPEGAGLGQSFAGVAWVAEPLRDRQPATAAVLLAGSLALVAAVPVTSGPDDDPVLDGVLAAAYALSAEEVEALRGIVRGETALLVNLARRGEPPAIDVSVASAGFAVGEVLAAVQRRPALFDALFGAGRAIGPVELDVDGDLRLLSAQPIASSRGEVLGAFVATRSRAEETRAFRDIRNAMLGTGLAGLAASVLVAFLLGRGIARPLEQLTRGALAIREGRLDVDLPERRRDEVGALAQAFRAMVDELAEKRALQELVDEYRRRPEVEEASPDARAGQATRESGPVIGEVFGERYRIAGLLGRGGTGSVYRATDLELDEVVALKVLSPAAFSGDERALETLKREIRHARRITHPNVVRVHDLGEAGTARFLTMEYVPGTTLEELVDQRGALALDPAVQILKQICRGLDAIHGAGLVHRDIKPQNTMVLPTGMVKLMDFGIARAAQEMTTDRAVTIAGTPAYMSPEQLLGRELDARTDLYALGVLMYRVFTGVRPFEGESLAAVVTAHVHAAPPAPSIYRPYLPAAIERVILACLAKEPGDRPASPRAVYEVLLRAPRPRRGARG